LGTVTPAVSDRHLSTEIKPRFHWACRLTCLLGAQRPLGKKDEAKAILGRLRGVLKQPRWTQSAEVLGFLREAEDLIESEVDPKKP
jgi:hypothetical protein